MNLTPFLLFDGNCAEAMSFYQSCLGGDLAVTKLADTPMKSQMPPQLHDRVAYAQLKGGQIDFSAKDWMHATQKPRQGNTVAMYLNGGQYQELRVIFDRLAVGADPELLDDLRDMPFGIYGHLADQFGVHWFFRGEKKEP